MPLQCNKSFKYLVIYVELWDGIALCLNFSCYFLNLFSNATFVAIYCDYSHFICSIFKFLKFTSYLQQYRPSVMHWHNGPWQINTTFRHLLKTLAHFEGCVYELNADYTSLNQIYRSWIPLSQPNISQMFLMFKFNFQNFPT